jgi:hypothetical protein
MVYYVFVFVCQSRKFQRLLDVTFIKIRFQLAAHSIDVEIETEIDQGVPCQQLNTFIYIRFSVRLEKQK